jgi:hypothetical protein
MHVVVRRVQLRSVIPVASGQWGGLPALLVAALLACPVAAWAGLQTCAGDRAEVEYHDAVAIEEVCTAVAAAVEFLAGYGLRQQIPLLIVLIDHPIMHREQITYGTYTRPRDGIEITSEAALAGLEPPPRMFGQLLSGPMYRALVAHEVAHAIAQQNSKVPQLGLVSQEYLGFVTLIGTLPELSRLEVIGSAGVGAWEAGDTISEMYLELGPHNFAVKSYLHLTGHADPQRFIAELLANPDRSFVVR